MLCSCLVSISAAEIKLVGIGGLEKACCCSLDLPPVSWTGDIHSLNDGFILITSGRSMCLMLIASVAGLLRFCVLA